MTHDNDTRGLSIRSRLDGFLTEWTAPLLSGTEKGEFLDLFRGLTKDCLGGTDASGRWHSDLTPQGAPMEFSCAVDHTGRGAIRFSVDPRPYPREPDRERAVIQRSASLAVPCSPPSSDVMERLLDIHMAQIPDLNRSYFGCGARFSPGGARAGRIYFKSSWLPSWSLYRNLSRLVSNDGLRLLRSSFIGQERIQGIGYDFSTQGLARVKIYVWAGVSAKDAGPALGAQLPGLRKEPIEELIAHATTARPALMPQPPVLLGIGFALAGDYCDLTVYLPIDRWGWDTFHSLRPALSAILSHWGLSADFSPAHLPEGPPWWRFLPTWVSLATSPRGEGLSLYFAPARLPVELRNASVSDFRVPPDLPCGESRTAFEMMVSKLLASEAVAPTDPTSKDS